MPLTNAQDYPIWLNAGIFLGAAISVWIAGTRLTHALDAISRKTGWGQAFVGMLLLGGITSLPEIANSVTSSWTGNPALAINNLLGSAAINILLLAVADAFIGRDALTSAVAQPSTLVMATACILLLVTIAAAITVTDFPILGVGVWSIAICALSIGAFWLSMGYNERAPWIVKGVDVKAEDEPEDDTSMRPLVITSIVTGAVIFVAGYALSQTGDALAEQTGIGTGMVGFALIGLATSMPELSSITAVLTGVFLIGLLERRNSTVMKMGWDSLAVMILFAGGLVLLYTVE